MLSLIGFFPAEVLGTVPDWLMVIVTTVTAYYLYHTLKSQREVQQLQSELFKIESIRFKESIKPVLKYNASDKIMKPGEVDKKILTIEVTNETNSSALNILKTVAENDHTHQIFIPIGFSDIRKFLTKGDSPLLFHFLIDLNNPASDHINFAMQYQDIAGTSYKQRVFCVCDNVGIEVHPSLPEIISL